MIIPLPPPLPPPTLSCDLGGRKHLKMTFKSYPGSNDLAKYCKTSKNLDTRKQNTVIILKFDQDGFSIE